MSSAVRILVNVIEFDKEVRLQVEPLKFVLTQVDNEILFFNGCTLIGMVCDRADDQASKMRDYIPKLLDLVRLRVDKVRKAAATLLAKICRIEQNREKLRELHGFEVLQSVMSHIKA